MCRANPLWGAPRIHGELLKLGIVVRETTVAKYMVKRRGPPSQAWKTFLENHLRDTIALDFFTIPTATAIWTARQLLQSCGIDDQPRYLIRDRGATFADA